MTRRLAIGALALGLTWAVGAAAGEPRVDIKNPAFKDYVAGDRYSGYLIADPMTRELQDDEFQNPAMLWVDIGSELWTKPEGEAGKSCQDCHGDVSSMKGVATRYPVYEEKIGKLMNIEQRINQCREEQMKAPAFKWESDELLGMTALVKMQSRGMPINVSIDGPAKPFFEKGKEFYYTRRGQFDLACKHCHEDYNEMFIRAEFLSQGQANGFPTYRLKWQKVGSLHRRFRGCNKNIRAEPYPFGSDEYTNLELYVMWRGRGLPVEAPSVRK